MQKINKVFLSLVIFCLISFLIPFNISADTQTYYTGTVDNKVNVYDYSYSGSSYTRYVWGSSDGIRYVALKHPLGNINVYAIALTSNLVSYSQRTDNPNISSINVNNSGYYSGNTFYYASASANFDNSDRYTTSLNVIDYDYDTFGSYQNQAYCYAFGSCSVDPAPSLNYGELIVGFHTNFSASGTTNNYTITSNTNLDTIEWENIDANGNDLQNKGLNVQIRAVPILYSANSKSALDLLGFQDAVVNYNDGLILWTGNFNDNHKSFIWNEVINQLQTSNPAFAITSLLTGSVWTRYGWIYQIRYNDVLNDYSSEWQTIYNSTSIKVSDSEKIVNQYYYHYPSGVGSDDQEIFHDINTVNNTTNNWYVNDVPIDPDASWLDSLIQAIAEIIGKILDFFSSIFDGLVDLILGLFGDINPADSFFNWFSNLFDGIGDIDLTLPQFNLPNADLTSFNRLVQETLDIFSLNNFGFVIFIPLLLIIIKAVF